MQAIILAGGKGNRLLPLTNYVPKPLLPIRGEPAIKLVIESLVRAGGKNIIIVLPTNRGALEDYLLHLQTDVPITYAHTHPYENRRGMAIGVMQTEQLVGEHFVVTACDTVFPASYIQELYTYHTKNFCDATLSVSDLGARDLLVGKSVVEISASGDIINIIEKPTLEQVTTSLVSTPLYAFSKKIFPHLEKLEPSRRGEYELQDAINSMIRSKGVVRGFMNPLWNSLDEWVMLNDGYEFLRLNFPYLKLPPR